MKDNMSSVNAKTNVLVNKDNLSYNINKRFKEKELSSITMCDEGDKCYLFTYSDSTSDKLIYSSTDKIITFNNYTFNITDDMKVDIPTITEHYDVMSSTKYNGYFIINIPITVDNKDYSIRLVKHFNTDSVVIDLRESIYDNSGNRYVLVEYLESTGTQYIDTGILSTNAKIDISFKFNRISGKSEVLVNCNDDTTGWFGLNSVGVITLHGLDFDINYSDKYDFILEYKNGRIMATVGDNTKKTTRTPHTTFKIFDEGSNRRFPSYANLYYTKIYDNDILVRDYIPVIDSSERPCLFDKVEKECYYNQGTGEFLYG